MQKCTPPFYMPRKGGDGHGRHHRGTDWPGRIGYRFHRGCVGFGYRLEQLEKRVEKHNNLIERTYKLEERTELQEEKIKVANHRIEDLENEVRQN